MIPLLDTSERLAIAEAEIGFRCEELITPLTRREREADGLFAIDNGAFSGFRESYFLSLLERNKAGQSKCRFVVVPDIVGSAIRTLRRLGILSEHSQ